MSAIVCRKLTKSYGAYPVLRGIDLEVERGELFGFLGPNGAGKTTTIRILTGLLLPSGGRVAVAGWDVVTDPYEVKRRVGYVPDRAFLYEKLTGGELLEFVGHLYGIDRGTARRRAAPYLEMFDLAGWSGELVEAYSHGMRQKLAIAAALLHQPEILVIDEPMVGLDPRSALKVKSLFTGLTESGVTVFLSTHTLEVAEALCSRIAILQQGRIVAQGTMDELRTQAMCDGGSLERIFLQLTEEEPVP